MMIVGNLAINVETISFVMYGILGDLRASSRSRYYIAISDRN